MTAVLEANGYRSSQDGVGFDPLKDKSYAATRLGRSVVGRGANDVRRPMARWNISRRNELLCLTRFFDFFELQSKKRRDYDVWREAVIDWYCSGLPASLVKYIQPLKDARKYRVGADG
jgi:hypothetical protein